MQPEALASRIQDPESPPLIMGILNVTSDSFYDGGRYAGVDRALKRVEEMLKEGVDIVDVGGESTRPGSDPVPLEEELKRVIPVVEAIKARFPDLPVSVDTYKARVAEEALASGAEIVNDISALRFDPGMPEVIKRYTPMVVLMHMKGTPKDMQQNPFYEDPVAEIRAFLEERKTFVINECSLPEELVIVDPGIGFGKRLQDNLLLIKHLDKFSKIAPVLLGPSRKSFIGAILNLPPEERLEGTLAAVAIGVFKGARIIRVHDVREAKRAATVAWEIAHVETGTAKV